MPVHSSAMSMPRSFQGSLPGSRSAVTLMAPLPMLMVSPLTVTVPGKRPCTLSKRSRCALVSTGPRSLMPTTSMSVRPDSAMARKTLRPMRPNPLMATRTVMTRSRSFKLRWPAAGLAQYRLLSLVPKLAQCRVSHPFRRNAEMLVEFLVGRAGAERRHAYENTARANDGVPALPHGGFDADIDFGVADDGAARRVRLRGQQFEARHRDDARGDALGPAVS